MTLCNYKLSERGWLALLAMVFLAGCATSPSARIFDTGSAVQQRSYQSRVFETDEKDKTLRTVMTTLQDLGFVIDQADATIGSVSGTKLDGYQLKMTVTVRKRNEAQLLVRANATFERRAIDNPATYQDFFIALEKAMFLTAHAVD